MSRRLTLITCCVAIAVGCDSFEKEEAAVEIRERVCGDWPYGCTDSTRVVVEDVHKTRNGRQVEFKLVDGEDETPPLSAAYFEPSGEEWRFLLFEDPFKTTFRQLAGQVETDRRRLGDALSQLKAAQRWFMSIYGRYANSLEALDSVSYKPPEIPIEMTVEEDGFMAEASTRYVYCELRVPGQQLPRCVGLTADHASTDSGPLSRAFTTP